MSDLSVVACNYRDGISPVPVDARAYVLAGNPGSGGDRIKVLARSRSGRWIEKWEDRRRLHNFRAKTIPDAHPLHGRLAHAPQPFHVPWLMEPQ